MGFRIPVIYGSIRSERRGIKAARYVVAELRRRGCEPCLIDPLEYPLPLLDKVHNEYEPGTAPHVVEELALIFRNADGFVIVSGEYNHSIPPVLSNLLDHFLEEYFWRPSGIVCYSGGRFGGVRAAMQLRAMLGELGMPSIPTLLPVPNVWESFDDEGNPVDSRFAERNAQFFDEFLWYTEALQTQRAKGVPY
jgi:NAD(P)H-dependent FMN reductase